MELFPTTSALLTAYPASPPLADGTMAATAGRTTAGDGGGGSFFYKQSDTTSADNSGTIRVDSVGRRWYYVPEADHIPVAVFGATPSLSDCTAQFNAALIGAGALNLPISLKGNSYNLTGSITMDVSKTAIIGPGTLDFTNLTTSYGIRPFTTWTDPNTMAAQHNTHPFKNFRINGPSVGPGKFCFSPVPITLGTTPWMTGIVLDSVSSNGWDVFFDICDGIVFLEMRTVIYGATTGHGSGWMFRNMGFTNTGENIYLDHCDCVNAFGLIIEQVQNPNMDMFLNCCSFDGLQLMMGAGNLGAPITAGVLGNYTFQGGHWEEFHLNSAFPAVWCGSAGVVRLHMVNLVPDTSPYYPFRSDSTLVGCGIILRDVNVNWTGQWYNDTICAGSGNFEITAKGNGNTFMLHYAYANNRQADYTFAASGSTLWSPNPALDSSDKPSGASRSAILAPNTITSFSTPCSPGQRIAAGLQWKISSLGSGDMVYLSAEYRDKNGNILGTQWTTGQNTNTSGWVTFSVAPQLLAPPGTERATVTFNYVTGAGGGSVKWALPRIIVS